MAIRPLPRPLTFTFPNGRKVRGFVIDEVYELQKSKSKKVMDYLNVIQFIKRDKGYWVRFCYYKKKFGQGEKDWQWGSQTTLTLPRKMAKALIKKAKKKGIL